jgi:hypothetical protein
VGLIVAVAAATVLTRVIPRLYPFDVRSSSDG